MNRSRFEVLTMIYYFYALCITIYGVWLLYQSNKFQWVAIVYGVSSVLVFGLYERDKQAAKNQMWRVPEFTLHCLELAGGWIGAFWGQRIFRHKTKKLSYQIMFWLIVTVHMGFWTDYAIFHLEGLSAILELLKIDVFNVLELFQQDNHRAIQEGTIEWSR